MDKNQLIDLFLSMTLINIGIFFVATVLLVGLRGWVAGLHARLFGIRPEQVMQSVYVWLGHYKLLIFVFNIAPYVALRLV